MCEPLARLGAQVADRVTPACGAIRDSACWPVDRADGESRFFVSFASSRAPPLNRFSPRVSFCRPDDADTRARNNGAAPAFGGR